MTDKGIQLGTITADPDQGPTIITLDSGEMQTGGIYRPVNES